MTENGQGAASDRLQPVFDDPGDRAGPRTGAAQRVGDRCYGWEASCWRSWNR